MFGLSKKQKELPPLFSESEITDMAIGFDAVVDYLQGLSDDEYGKVIKVADIYRKTNQEAAAVLGVANEPTTFIKPEEPELVPAHVNHPLPKTILDEDDDLSAAFLDDEPEQPKKRIDGVAKKVKVKGK